MDWDTTTPQLVTEPAQPMTVHTFHATRSRKRNPAEQTDVLSTKRVCRKARKNFLDLPRELRDIIYEHSLVTTEAIDVCRLATSPCNAKKLGISIALLRVSRQIHGEALEVMYGLNTFEAMILLDPRISHSYRHDLNPGDPHIDRMFKTPMTKEVKRLMVRLEFDALSPCPSQDPSFPAEVLQDFVLDGNLDIIVLKPGCFSSYLESLQRFNTALATANAALAVARGSLFSTYLLSCVSVCNRNTLVVYTPQSHRSFRYLDFPWIPLDPQYITTANQVSCYIPWRFKSTGQMKSGESMN